MERNTSLTGKAILLVDDSKILHYITRMSLGKIANVFAAETAQAARDLLLTRRFDLVILDYMLPLENGLSLASFIREKWSSTELPILLVSASLDDTMRADALAAGVNDFLKKPVANRQLFETVEKLLQGAYSNVGLASIHYSECQWRQNGQAVSYCPELDVRFTARSQDEAHRLLDDYVRNKANEQPLELVGEIQVFKHRTQQTDPT